MSAKREHSKVSRSARLRRVAGGTPAVPANRLTVHQKLIPDPILDTSEPRSVTIEESASHANRSDFGRIAQPVRAREAGISADGRGRFSGVGRADISRWREYCRMEGNALRCNFLGEDGRARPAGRMGMV